MCEEEGIAHESHLVIADVLVEEVSIDGMCGVY
ncbi:mycofactocin precursor MftA [Nocardia vinacea]|uniref:Mycofactocin MftA n=1 Tax=Nocardia vinacea TaxID=96468 RepID=A0ABZ1Z054_9NOCA|nr:mycofactocin precursor MftA [Nocardia vinacea]